jgi:hypothetical protein
MDMQQQASDQALQQAKAASKVKESTGTFGKLKQIL